MRVIELKYIKILSTCLLLLWEYTELECILPVGLRLFHRIGENVSNDENEDIVLNLNSPFDSESVQTDSTKLIPNVPNVEIVWKFMTGNIKAENGHNLTCGCIKGV